MYADLHLHSTYSDGTDTPAELMGIARKEGLSVVAIADHDSVAGVRALAEAGIATPVRNIPAIEISTIANRRLLHMLGYYIDVYSPELASFIVEISKDKTENTRINLENAMAKTGFTYFWDRVVFLNPGQPRLSGVHVARAMEQDGFTPPGMTLREMFREYFLPTGGSFIETEKMTAYDAVDIIKKAGGVPVIAHPKSIGNDDTVLELIRYGVWGLEVYHPAHEPEESEKYRSIVEEKGLCITGGSDWHGQNDPGITHMGMTGLVDDTYTILHIRQGYWPRPNVRSA